MTAAQRLWYILNIQQDKTETARYVETLCKHIRPDAYFKKEADAVSTDFAASIEQQLGRELTPEEKIALNIVDDEDVDVDVIERA